MAVTIGVELFGNYYDSSVGGRTKRFSLYNERLLSDASNSHAATGCFLHHPHSLLWNRLAPNSSSQR